MVSTMVGSLKRDSFPIRAFGSPADFAALTPLI
jgi:hypothetical protein